MREKPVPSTVDDHMCGIVGKVMPPRSGPVDRGLLERMCVALEHRGPDSRGVFADEQAGLGIQRLRVIDLETGDQPISNEDGSVVIVLNGEIYNFRELRDRLRGNGHQFATGSDTEVIVHLYEEHGAGCVRHLHGMFAFALWDRQRRRLLLARDRVGKKPLFFAVGPGGLTFASELRALIEDRQVKTEIDPRAVDCYLAYGYVPAPMSIFTGVYKLEPAHTLLLDGGNVTIERYWTLDYANKLGVEDPVELREPIRDAIRLATAQRMIADVPVGAFLSGGIDSSAVVAAMAEASTGPVRTFSIGFENDAFDELPYARRIAQLFGTEHHEFVVRPDAVSILPKLVRHFGEPFADSSAIPSFYLAELTRSHVTVALNGDGGDEAFGGYTRFVANRLASRLDQIPGSLRRGAAAGFRGRGSGELTSLGNKARRLIQGLALEPPARYERYVSWCDATMRARLYSDEFAALVTDSPAAEVIAGPWREASGRDVLDKMLEVEINTYLPGDLIPKIDIATMAHALEARSPLLDQHVMELAASIPAELKVRGRQKKWILREALRDWLPDEILDRPKQGFSVPVGDWLRHELRDLARDVLLDPGSLARGYFRPEAIRSMLDNHRRGADQATKPIWALFMFELWNREFVDFTAAPSLLDVAA